MSVERLLLASGGGYLNGHSFISNNLNKIPISELVSPQTSPPPSDNDRARLENKALNGRVAIALFEERIV